MVALERANQVRTLRAMFWREMRAAGRPESDRMMALILDNPPEWALTWKVEHLLTRAPHVGRVVTLRLMRTIGMSPGKTVGGLTPRQREGLVFWFRHRNPRVQSAA
jgi:hypothetical protein